MAKDDKELERDIWRENLTAVIYELEVAMNELAKTTESVRRALDTIRSEMKQRPE